MKRNLFTKISALFLTLLMACSAFVPAIAEEVNTVFIDVPDVKWYANAVKYVAENGLMTGTAEGVFSPGVGFTRAMAVQVLAQLSGDDLSGYTGNTSPFLDVVPDKWYTKAVEWAKDKEISAGIGAKFDPAGLITREQLAIMVHQFATKYVIVNDFAAGPDNTDGFADAKWIHAWAKDGVNWAVYNGLLGGIGNNMLDPRGTVTRAQAAQIFYNLHYMKVNSILPPDTTEFDKVTVEESDEMRLVCWGNSMTQNGYPKLLDDLTGIFSRDMASGGDTSEHIAMKQGGIPLYVAPFTIPASKDIVEVKLLNEDLKEVESLADLGANGLSPVIINGVTGFISNRATDDSDNYYFQRNDKGPYEEVEVTRLTRVVTKGARDLKSKDIHIIYSSPHNGNPDDYIDILKRMIDYSQSGKYIIIGFTSPESGILYEKLTEEFGRNFIDIKTYFHGPAFEDAGVEPTEEDLENIADGRLPETFRSDNIHGNSLFHELLADQIVLRLKEVGYID